MFKRFKEWIQIKQKLHESSSQPFFKEGEVWWCGVGENVGSEIDGKGYNFTRPVLIYKRFSKEIFFGVPLTTKIKTGSWFVQITFKSKIQTIILTQGRIYDVSRLHNAMGQVAENDFKKIKDGFHRLYL